MKNEKNDHILKKCKHVFKNVPVVYEKCKTYKK